GGDPRRRDCDFPGVVQPSQPQQQRRGTEVSRGILRFERNRFLMSVEGLLVTSGERRVGRELRPDVDHLGLLTQDSLKQLDRLWPTPDCRVLERSAVGFQDAVLVLRVYEV